MLHESTATVSDLKNIQIKKLNLQDPKIIDKKIQYREFIHEYLGEFRDSKEEIDECLGYAFNESKGGHLYCAELDNRLLGLVVVLNTNMVKFVPEYLLVYIAVRDECRGQGIGRKLLAKVQGELQGSIALHVEPQNPAVNLYMRMGFTNKYLEMRFKK